MKKNARPKILTLAVAGSLFFITACNDSEYTKNASENTPAKSDTATSNAPVTDTSSASVSPNKPMANKNSAGKSKRKVSIGQMAERKTSGMKPDKDGVYEMTEVRPAYPGGQAALEDYINNNIEYQQAAVDNNTEGTVDVQFVVDENGNVSNPKVVGNELGGGLDDEAVRVISRMPKWTPGKVKGKNVKTRVVLPITYKIEQ